MILKYPEWKQTLYITLCIGFVFSGLPGRCQQPSCTDASLLANYNSGSFGNALYLSSPLSASTADNGAVFFMNKEAVSSGATVDSLLVFKLDATGSVVWTRALPESTPDLLMQFSKIVALHNGNLLLAGNSAYLGGNSGPALSTLLLLDASGNVLWQKNYTGLALTVCSEGLNGEITAAGWAPGKLFITRLSTDGTAIWSNSYLYNKNISINPDGLYYDNGRLYMGGDYTDPFALEYSIGFWLIKLDYPTGQVLGNGSWKITLPAFSCQQILSPGTNMTATPGDRLLFSAGLVTPTGCPNHTLFFTRVDSNLQAIPGGTASFNISLAKPDGESMAIHRATGSVALGANDKAGSTGAYYAILDSSLTITIQRNVTISDPSANPIFCFNGYDLVGSQAGLQSGNGSYQFIRADPGIIAGGACMGTPASLLTPQPITCTPFGLQFTLNGANAIGQNAFPVGENDFSITTDILCQQVSTCDSLQIHGDTSFCPGDQTAIFTALKSSTCLKQNTWQVDTTVFSILGRPNDTTIQLGFNREWTGYIYATIAGCGLKDSLPVTIHGQLPPVNLAPDTVLCPGTTILLQPQGSFQTYKWQDGSTGAAYQVKDTGTYYVSVTDFCGNRSSDTLRVRDCRKALYFPNAFTPNHDGANDLFRPLVNGELKEFEMAVYNRWGELIFTTTDLAKGWDGSFRGRLLPPGVFVWFCRYQFAGDSPKQEKGTVMLIR